MPAFDDVTHPSDQYFDFDADTARATPTAPVPVPVPVRMPAPAFAPPTAVAQVVPPTYVYMQPVMPNVIVTTAPPQGASIASFVLGLCSLLFGFTLVLPLIGLILGFVGIAKERTARGYSITGIVLNGLCMLGWVVAAWFVFAWIAAIGAAVQTAAATGYSGT